MNVDQLNTMRQTLPVVRVGAYLGAAYLVGRKAAQGLAAGTFAVGSKVADYVDNAPLATKLATTSNVYLTAAKKNLARDFCVAGALIATGLRVEAAEDFVQVQLADKKEVLDNMQAYASNMANSAIDKANSGYRAIFGEERHLLQRLSDGILSTKNYLVDDVRLTSPYQPSLLRLKDQQALEDQWEKVINYVMNSAKASWKNPTKAMMADWNRITNFFSNLKIPHA